MKNLAWWEAAAGVVVCLAATGACGGSVVLTSADAGPGTGGQPGQGAVSPNGAIVSPFQQDGVDKIDLLFMIDNSASMADKQQVLAKAVPGLLDRLVNPGCVQDADMMTPEPLAGNNCPFGSSLELKPIADIHIGIISSSLGGHGSDSCPDNDPVYVNNNDQGHLLSRKANGTVPTWNGNSGFLAWDPGGTRNAPPGESSSMNLENNFRDMVVGVGQVGCGFEASLEAWYRFLIDPQPPQNISAQAPNPAQLSGRDDAVLAQRAAFLRPDSVVAVILLSDENDCSVIESNGLAYLSIADPPNTGAVDYIPSGTTPCKTNPNDPCCFNCGQPTPPDTCPGYDIAGDPACDSNNSPLTDVTDNFSLRCFDQKRKYGIDFLNPIQRYVDGLTKSMIQQRDGQMVPNPLYSDLQCNGGMGCKSIRSPSLVFFAGIVGVPWQDIAVDPTDLRKGFKTSGQIESGGIWPMILGDPTASPPVLPSDPLMIETPFPRQGTNPVTGQVLAGKTAGPTANSINGHEWNTEGTTPAEGDLQYACVFDLPTPKDCTTMANIDSCDCSPYLGDPNVLQSPLCQDLRTGAYSTTQYRAKGYPGVRELQVLQGIGDQAIVASICPAELGSDENAADFGYNPAVNAILNKLKGALAPRCLPRQLTVDPATQSVSCVVLEAFNPPSGLNCAQTCMANGRAVADPQVVTPDVKSSGSCICEMLRLDGADGTGCLNDAKDAKAQNEPSGWCYISPSQGLGTCAALGPSCFADGQTIRFYGPQGDPLPDAKIFISCASAAYNPANPSPAPGGITCVP